MIRELFLGFIRAHIFFHMRFHTFNKNQARAGGPTASGQPIHYCE
jgi:hypothetical protein